jgi:hypothetical protein
MTLQAAEELASNHVLKGHSFSCAAKSLYFSYPERALAREGSAFRTFSATSLVVPQTIEKMSDFSPCGLLDVLQCTFPQPL